MSSGRWAVVPSCSKPQGPGVMRKAGPVVMVGGTGRGEEVVPSLTPLLTTGSPPTGRRPFPGRGSLTSPGSLPHSPLRAVPSVSGDGPEPARPQEPGVRPLGQAVTPGLTEAGAGRPRPQREPLAQGAWAGPGQLGRKGAQQ